MNHSKSMYLDIRYGHKAKPDKWGCVQACQLWYVHICIAKKEEKRARERERKGERERKTEKE